MESTFVGRISQLSAMDRVWESSQASLMILYGRRRVGKTRLLTHWIRHNDIYGLYWMAEATSALDQLRSFSQALADFEDPEMDVPLDLSYPNWEYALRRAANLARDRRLVLFIDEVTYLMDVTPSIVGTFQKAWDQWLSQSNIFLALCGSQMGLMQRELIAHDAPLYGRANIQMKLEPLRFGATKQFFPDYDAWQRVQLYTIWGGIPAYWERLDQSLSVLGNLEMLLMPSNSWMMDEPRLLLQDFVNDPHNYVGIMRTIAKGTQTFSDIGKQTGLSMGHTSQYLSLLRDTGFVERRIPVTETNPNSRRGRYFVTDPYLRFYYRFLAAYHSKLAMGQHQQTMVAIESDLPAFIEQNTWLDLCQEWLLRASDQGELPFAIEDVGGEWKRSFMVDVVGYNPTAHQLVLGVRCWNAAPVDATPLCELIDRTKAVLTKDDEALWTVYYIGFFAGGWQSDVLSEGEAYAQSQASGRGRQRWQVAGVRLLDLETVDNDLARWTI